jgi:hypothetical protein
VTHWMATRLHLLRPLAYQLILLASSVLSIMVWLGFAACLVALVAELALSVEGPPSQPSTS